MTKHTDYFNYRLLTHKELDTFNQDGYVILKNILRPSGLSKMRNADDSLAQAMEMGAGDVLIFNCWMLHKSDGNYSTDRDRRILFLRYADADAVEVYNNRKPRLGRLVRGSTIYEQVRNFEVEL